MANTVTTRDWRKTLSQSVQSGSRDLGQLASSDIGTGRARIRNISRHTLHYTLLFVPLDSVVPLIQPLSNSSQSISVHIVHPRTLLVIQLLDGVRP